MKTTIENNPHAAGVPEGTLAAHTPTPWATEGSFVIHPASGMTVADCQLHRDILAEIKEDNANAAFIVRACNSHAQLVELLQWFTDASESGELKPRDNDAASLRAFNRRLELARRALEAAQ